LARYRSLLSFPTRRSSDLDIAKKYDVTICTFGHAGDGNLHPTCLTDARNQEEMERVDKAFEEIFKKAVELGGTITGEHGIGAMRSEEHTSELQSRFDLVCR